MEHAHAVQIRSAPFIGLNLLFSCQASDTGPVLQMMGNRQAAKGRLHHDTEAREVSEMSGMHRIELVVLRQHDQVPDQQNRMLVQIAAQGERLERIESELAALTPRRKAAR